MPQGEETSGEAPGCPQGDRGDHERGTPLPVEGGHIVWLVLFDATLHVHVLYMYDALQSCIHVHVNPGWLPGCQFFIVP